MTLYCLLNYLQHSPSHTFGFVFTYYKFVCDRINIHRQSRWFYNSPKRTFHQHTSKEVQQELKLPTALAPVLLFKWVFPFFKRHLFVYHVFLFLLSDIFCYPVLIPSNCTDVVSSTPKMPVSIFIFQI